MKRVACAPGNSRPRKALAAAGAGAAAPTVSSQEPTLIGEVSLKTRSIFTKRSGLPRSEVKSRGLTPSPAKAIIHDRRAST
jgi:hypothetical protein